MHKAAQYTGEDILSKRIEASNKLDPAAIEAFGRLQAFVADAGSGRGTAIKFCTPPICISFNHHQQSRCRSLTPFTGLICTRPDINCKTQGELVILSLS